MQAKWKNTNITSNTFFKRIHLDSWTNQLFFNIFWAAAHFLHYQNPDMDHGPHLLQPPHWPTALSHLLFQFPSPREKINGKNSRSENHGPPFFQHHRWPTALSQPPPLTLGKKHSETWHSVLWIAFLLAMEDTVFAVNGISREDDKVQRSGSRLRNKRD